MRREDPPVRHRHLDVPAGYHSVATILSVLERGTSRDVIALLADLQADPFSALADDALAACDQSDVYGYPALIRLCVRRWRGLDGG
jgi:hypothetical protein